MRVWMILRAILLVIASLGYFANGAQAHVHVSSGDAFEVMLCGSGTSRVMTLDIPGEPIEETDHTWCGDCVPTFGLEPPALDIVHVVLVFSRPLPRHAVLAVFPRSPLWPGAPPHGPPHVLKA